MNLISGRNIIASLLITGFFFQAGASPAKAQELSPVPGEGSRGRLITISEGIKMVLKDSRLIKIASAGKDMAVDETFLARSALLPQVSGTLSESFLSNQPAAKFGSAEVNTAEKRSFSYGFDVYQTLYDFNRSMLNYKASRLLAESRDYGFRQTRKLAVLEFVVAYFDLLEARKMIEVAEKEVQSISAYSGDVEKLFAQGAAIKNDLLAARVRLADARQKLIIARNFKELAHSRLLNILALPISRELEVQDIKMGIPDVPALENAWKQAEAQREEISIIDGQVAASEASRQAKLTGNYPTVYADGGYNRTQNKFLVHDDNFFVNLGAKLDLYDGGFSRAQAREELDHKRQLTEQRQKIIDDIKLEVKDSYLGVRDAVEKVAVSLDALAQSEENVKVNRNGFSEGSNTSTDVLEAITLQTTAQTNYYRADYQLKRDYTKLMYSMGIDLELVYDSIQKGN